MRSTRGTRLQGARQFRSFKTQVWRFSFQRVTVKKAFQSTEESELPACKSERAGHGQHWPSFMSSGGLVEWLVTSYKATPGMVVKRASKEGWREKFTHLNKAFTSFEPIVFYWWGLLKELSICKCLCNASRRDHLRCPLEWGGGSRKFSFTQHLWESGISGSAATLARSWYSWFD